uniref:Putative secreted protein n=1 Tax=Anopheles triannulatus TaxID=58253 RepID=A0A2M4B2Z9_9DIPT
MQIALVMSVGSALWASATPYDRRCKTYSPSTCPTWAQRIELRSWNVLSATCIARRKIFAVNFAKPSLITYRIRSSRPTCHCWI